VAHRDIQILGEYAIVVSVFALIVHRVYLSKGPIQLLASWFTVTFDERRVTILGGPPGVLPSEQSFHWSEVRRVCFKAEATVQSDEIFVFVSGRAQAYVIPTECAGGIEFWAELVGRGLFPQHLALMAAAAPDGTTLCWPALGDQGFRVLPASEAVH